MTKVQLVEAKDRKFTMPKDCAIMIGIKTEDETALFPFYSAAAAALGLDPKMDVKQAQNLKAQVLAKMIAFALEFGTIGAGGNVILDLDYAMEWLDDQVLQHKLKKGKPN